MTAVSARALTRAARLPSIRVSVAELALLGYLRYQRERHFAAARPLDPLAGKLAEAAPPLGRIPDHHVDFLAAPLDALDIRAVEAGAQLLADQRRSQPCGLPCRGQLDLEVALARCQVVVDAVDARHGLHPRPQLGGSASQRLHVVVLERIGNARPHLDAPGAEFGLLQVRHGTDGLAPRALDLSRARAAVGLIAEMQTHGGEMAAVQPAP